jgi:hypothetical protein
MHTCLLLISSPVRVVITEMYGACTQVFISQCVSAELSRIASLSCVHAVSISVVGKEDACMQFTPPYNTYMHVVSSQYYVFLFYGIDRDERRALAFLGAEGKRIRMMMCVCV